MCAEMNKQSSTKSSSSKKPYILGLIVAIMIVLSLYRLRHTGGSISFATALWHINWRQTTIKTFELPYIQQPANQSSNAVLRNPLSKSSDDPVLVALISSSLEAYQIAPIIEAIAAEDIAIMPVVVAIKNENSNVNSIIKAFNLPDSVEVVTWPGNVEEAPSVLNTLSTLLQMQRVKGLLVGDTSKWSQLAVMTAQTLHVPVYCAYVGWLPSSTLSMRQCNMHLVVSTHDEYALKDKGVCVDNILRVGSLAANTARNSLSKDNQNAEESSFFQVVMVLDDARAYDAAAQSNLISEQISQTVATQFVDMQFITFQDENANQTTASKTFIDAHLANIIKAIAHADAVLVSSTELAAVSVCLGKYTILFSQTHQIPHGAAPYNVAHTVEHATTFLSEAFIASQTPPVSIPGAQTIPQYCTPPTVTQRIQTFLLDSLPTGGMFTCQAKQRQLMSLSSSHTEQPIAMHLQKRVTCSQQQPIHREQPRSYYQLMGLPSTYQPKSPDYKPQDFTLTIIVAVYRRPQYFERLLWSFGNQTHTPDEVWVTIFGSAQEDEFRSIIRRVDPKHTVFKFISGDPNLKYFGRFALGTMAKTNYVALFDDDCIPGREVMASMLHIINIEGGEYNGLIGMKGHGNNADTTTDHEQPIYFRHWEYRARESVPVDLTGGMWFLRTEWLRMMWVERPIPILGGFWETGEDFQLSYGLRKYLGVNTFLTPVAGQETWPHSYDYMEISRAGDSTKSDSLYERAHIHFELFMRGYVPARAYTVWGETHGVANIAVVLSSEADADALHAWYVYLQKNANDTFRILPIIAADPRQSSTRESIITRWIPGWKARARIVGVWDLALSKLGQARWDDNMIIRETQSALAGVLETLKPAVLIQPVHSNPAVAAAVGVTAQMMKVPLVGYAHSPDCVSTRLPKGDLCLPPHPVTSTHTAPFSMITNSQLALVNHLVDVGCACAQPNSTAIGTFAKCNPGAHISDSTGFTAPTTFSSTTV